MIHMINEVAAETKVGVEIEMEMAMEAGADVVGEARDFRKALTDWARGYLATRRLGVRPEQFTAAFKADLRSWSSGYCERLAAPSVAAPSVGERSVPTWSVGRATPELAALANIAAVPMGAANPMVFPMNPGATF